MECDGVDKGSRLAWDGPARQVAAASEVVEVVMLRHGDKIGILCLWRLECTGIVCHGLLGLKCLDAVDRMNKPGGRRCSKAE